MTYDKETLGQAVNNPKAQEIYYSGYKLSSRAWNRHVAGFILDDFLEKMADEDALEFMQYTNVLPLIQVGMFDTASRYLKQVVIPALQSQTLKTRANVLAETLASSDNYPKEA
jgi:muramidase (phage lysozyme)